MCFGGTDERSYSMNVKAFCVLLKISAVTLSALLAGCGKVEGKDEIIHLPVTQKTSSASGSDSTGNGAGSGKTGSGNVGAGNPVAPANPGSTPVVAAMTLTEAKAKCAACHTTGGSGAGVWSTANGSEADWKDFAPAAKDSVVAGRMPLGLPLSPDEKARLIAFLDNLMGITPPAGGSADGGSGPSAPPAVKTFTFATARVLCVGCHSAAAPAAVREKPYLETLDQWVSNQKDIEDEVEKMKMPRGKTLTDQERSALLDFIRTL
jgi:mono/diheme cytochrome c family protein